MVTTIVVGFLVSQVLAVVVHGFCRRNYAPFEGTLLRAAECSGHASMADVVLPIAHLSFISAMVWSCGHLQMSGSAMVQGLTLGVFGWLDQAGATVAPVVRRTAMARRTGRKAVGTRAGVVLDHRSPRLRSRLGQRS